MYCYLLVHIENYSHSELALFNNPFRKKIVLMINYWSEFCMKHLKPMIIKFIATLISAAAITIFEYFFHKYILSYFKPKTDRVLPRPRPLQTKFQTESSEDISPEIKKNNKNK